MLIQMKNRGTDLRDVMKERRTHFMCVRDILEAMYLLVTEVIRDTGSPLVDHKGKGTG